MRDTETDAAIKEQSEWKRVFVSTTLDGVTYDGPVASLCRRMERERDEAREKAERYRLEANALMMQRDEAREALGEAIQFRDTSLSGYDLDGWMRAAGVKT
jgi:hypothetical protein